MIAQRVRPACAPSAAPGADAFRGNQLAGGLERKRQDLWSGS